MRSNIVPVVMALIVIVFAVAAYYYWHGGDSKSEPPIEGVVLDKFQRAAGTEAGDKPLAQGLQVLTGQSLRQDMFYFIRVLTTTGREVDMEVPADLYRKAELGDKITRASRDSIPVIVR